MRALLGLALLLAALPALAQQAPPAAPPDPPPSGDCGCGATATRGGPR